MNHNDKLAGSEAKMFELLMTQYWISKQSEVCDFCILRAWSQQGWKQEPDKSQEGYQNTVQVPSIFKAKRGEAGNFLAT